MIENRSKGDVYPMFSVKSVVCDYGLYEDDKLLIVINSHRNAELIKAILEKDALCNVVPYTFTLDDMKKFEESHKV